MPKKIFISYSRKDQDIARQINKKLEAADHDPWLDAEDILPGENWERAINKAIEDADFFIAVISKNSIDRRGVIQKEIRLALDKMDEFLPDDLFIIPLRLDDCEIPERLTHLQILDWESGSGLGKLLSAIDIGLAKREDENKDSSKEQSNDQSSTSNFPSRNPLKKLPPSMWVAIITSLGLIITTVIANFGAIQPKLLEIRSTQTAEAQHTAIAMQSTQITEPQNTTSALTQEVKPTNTPTRSPTDTPFPASSPTRCPFQEDSDEETLRSLIDAEANAVMNEDLETINNIFLQSAKPADIRWEPVQKAYDYYKAKFDNEEHRNIKHDDFIIDSQTAITAVVNTKVTGEWFDSKSQEWKRYGIYPGFYDTNIWEFEKVDGCWRIVGFTYNLSLVTPTPKP